MRSFIWREKCTSERAIIYTRLVEMVDNSLDIEVHNHTGVVICIAKYSRASSTIYARKVDKNNQAIGVIFELRNNRQNVVWHNGDVSSENILSGSFITYKKDGDYFIYCNIINLKPKVSKKFRCFKRYTRAQNSIFLRFNIQ